MEHHDKLNEEIFVMMEQGRNSFKVEFLDYNDAEISFIGAGIVAVDGNEEREKEKSYHL